MFRVPAGTFDVDLIVNTSTAVPGAPTDSPLRAAEGIVINANRSLDLDVALFDVDTSVRMGGQQPLDVTSSFNEVTVRFTDTNTRATFRFLFQCDHPRQVFRIPTGTFDVELVVNSPDSVPGGPAGTPVRAAEGVLVNANRSLDLDVALFDVDTLVRVGGQQPLDVFSNFDEVTVRFTNTNTRATVSFSVGSNLPNHVFRVPAGTFDVDLIVNTSTAVPGAPTDSPLRAAEGIVINANRSLDLDVALFNVDTSVRMGGQQPLDVTSSFNEVTVRFTDTNTRATFRFPFQCDHPRQVFRIPTGTFDVELVVNSPDSVPGGPAGTPVRVAECIVVE